MTFSTRADNIFCNAPGSAGRIRHGGSQATLRVSILASGSSGNCTLLETERTRILVDAGIGKKETLRRIAGLSLPDAHLDAIVVSHEHSDHIGGLGQALGKWRDAVVYISSPTHAELLRFCPEVTTKRLQRVEHIAAGQRFTIGDVEVTAFAIPHDAIDPLAFTFRSNGFKAAIVTDLGYMPGLARQHLRDCDLMVLESNHDVEMLKVSPYPWFVKQRVMSRMGHLSNHAVSEFLADADGFDARPRHLVLAHLSENNNNPDVAQISAEEALRRRPLETAFAGQLHVASQRVPLGPIVL